MKDLKIPKIIEMRKVDVLLPYARNARTHSDAQIAQIAASIVEFGWTNPIIIGMDDVIIAGHGRVMAARKLGMHEVPCIVMGHLSESQRRALVIADNKLALNSGWDEDMLSAEIQSLLDDNFDLKIAGFSENELSSFFDDEKVIDETNKAEQSALQFQIIVECTDESHQSLLMTQFEREKIKCRPLIL